MDDDESSHKPWETEYERTWLAVKGSSVVWVTMRESCIITRPLLIAKISIRAAVLERRGLATCIVIGLL